MQCSIFQSHELVDLVGFICPPNIFAQLFFRCSGQRWRDKQWSQYSNSIEIHSEEKETQEKIHWSCQSGDGGRFQFLKYRENIFSIKYFPGSNLIRRICRRGKSRKIYFSFPKQILLDGKR